MNKNIVFIVLLTLLSVLSYAVQSGVSIYKLNNGLDVLLIKNKALPMVGVNVVVKTGSAYETYETSGMSHMLEHLLFNGTSTRSQRELYDDVDLIGGYNNANTGDYYTNFMMVMPAEHYITGMEIQADMLFNSTLPEEKFKKEKGIVLEEIAQSLSDPTTQMDYNLAAELYRGHALSLPTLGTYSTIEHMSRDDVYHYYQSTYLPNNMIMSVIGNFDSANILKEINRIYGAAAPGSVFRPQDSILKTGLTKPENLGLKSGTWLDRYYDGDENILHQIYLLPENQPAGFLTLLEAGVKDHLADIETSLKNDYPDDVATLDLEMHSSPIADYLILKLILTRDSNAEEINKKLIELTQKIKFRFSEATLASIVTGAKTDFLQNIEKPHMFGIYNTYDFAVYGIDAVLHLPSRQELEKAAKKLKKFHLKKEPAVVFHHAKTIDATQRKNNIMTTLVQDSEKGTGLIVRQNPASELLAVHYLFKYKSAYEAKYGTDAAKILHDCFGQRMKSPEKIALSQQYGLNFIVNDNPWIPMDNIYLHPDFGYIRVEGLADDLEGALTFLNTEMNSFIPTQAEYELARVKFSHGTGMSYGGKDLAKETFNTLRDSVLYGSTDKTKPKTLSYVSLLNFAKAYFSPNNRIISVVSPGASKTVAKQLLSGTKTTPSNRLPLSEKAYITPEASVAIDIAGNGKRSYLFWGFIKKIVPEDKAAVKAMSLILSDKIIFDVREKQGMAYRMSATSSVRDDKVLFYISLGTRPQNTDILLPQFPQLMSRETLDALTEKDVQKAINVYLGHMMFRRLSSINQAYYLGTSLFFHNDMNHDQAFLDALKKVKLDDIKRMAEKYLTPDKTLSIVVR